jgi:hypothetical protein
MRQLEHRLLGYSVVVFTNKSMGISKQLYSDKSLPAWGSMEKEGVSAA